jgi:hypothetical protein
MKDQITEIVNAWAVQTQICDRQAISNQSKRRLIQEILDSDLIEDIREQNELMDPELTELIQCLGLSDLDFDDIFDSSEIVRERFLEKVKKELPNAQFTSGYAEPGYSADFEIVILANWNNHEELEPIIERLDGIDGNWSDEFAICSDCNKAVRVTSDSYFWQPYYVLFNDCELVCLDCLKGREGDYLESTEGQEKVGSADGIDPENMNT